MSGGVSRLSGFVCSPLVTVRRRLRAASGAAAPGWMALPAEYRGSWPVTVCGAGDVPPVPPHRSATAVSAALCLCSGLRRYQAVN